MIDLYTVHALSLGKLEQQRPEFLKISPNGRIPAIVDRECEDFAVFESGAILIYLAEKTGSLMPEDTKGRSRVIQWLMFQMGGIEVPPHAARMEDGRGGEKFIREARKIVVTGQSTD